MVPILCNRPLFITMPQKDSLSLTDARRITLAHQGLARPRPASPVTREQVRDQLHALSLLQIDSVNVLVRSHYLPLFSRLGAYAPGDRPGAHHASTSTLVMRDSDIFPSPRTARPNKPNEN